MKSGSRSPSTPSFTVTDAVTLPFPHLSGAVDIVCVKQKDGGLLSSPFYVRFGKYQVSSSIKTLPRDRRDRRAPAFLLGAEGGGGGGDRKGRGISSQSLN